MIIKWCLGCLIICIFHPCIDRKVWTTYSISCYRVKYWGWGCCVLNLRNVKKKSDSWKVIWEKYCGLFFLIVWNISVEYFRPPLLVKNWVFNLFPWFWTLFFRKKKEKCYICVLYYELKKNKKLVFNLYSLLRYFVHKKRISVQFVSLFQKCFYIPRRHRS